MARETSKRDRLPQWSIQIAGLVVIGAAFAVWAITGRETATFVGAGLILVGVGGPLASLFNKDNP